MVKHLENLFEQYTGNKLEECTELTSSGSNRKYYRLKGRNVSIMGVIGTSYDENNAFCELSNHFLDRGIRVPKVYAKSADGMCYLQEDLGDNQLFQIIKEGRDKGQYSLEESQLLCKTIEQLPKLQVEGAKGLDFNVCYPEPAFNERMVMFDLNYFKYCFLKTSGLEFNEVLLQDDFEKLKTDLMLDHTDTFMYRDFQARNVMIKDGEPYFIDFQGGRRGPIYYDVASFIWQARSRYSEDLKQKLIRTYLHSLKTYMEVDESKFMERLRLFVLFRMLQVLGAYGFRGYFEKKTHFLESVPFAIDNLRNLIATPFEDYPYLNKVIEELTKMPKFCSDVARKMMTSQPSSMTSTQNITKNQSKKDDDNKELEVHIYSFSYKKGIPEDTSGNGGGYVFDCRSIHNPGRYEFYRQFNGMDKEVIDFLEDDGEITVFLDSVYKLVDAHVKRFIERKFTHLQVSFGCTGGQHRSVYSAEHLSEYLSRKYDIKVRVTHRELKIEKIV